MSVTRALFTASFHDNRLTGNKREPELPKARVFHCNYTSATIAAVNSFTDARNKLILTACNEESAGEDSLWLAYRSVINAAPFGKASRW